MPYVKAGFIKQVSQPKPANLFILELVIEAEAGDNGIIGKAAEIGVLVVSGPLKRAVNPYRLRVEPS